MKPERMLAKVLSGTAALGFTERVRGSHHIFARPDIDEIINLQPSRGGSAKPHQVKQVRAIIVAYGLAGDLER